MRKATIAITLVALLAGCGTRPKMDIHMPQARLGTCACFRGVVDGFGLVRTRTSSTYRMLTAR